MNRVKILKTIMLITLIVFVGVVIASYRSGTSISDTTADEDLRGLVDGEQLIQTEFNQKSYEKEKLKTEISAREMVNYQDGVNVLEDLHLRFGKDGMDVRSDFGRHDSESGDSFLWENVLFNDGQGMTIETASALHNETTGLLAGDKTVTFSDSRLSGSSLGVLYDMNSGELQLPAEVDLTISGGDGADDQPVRVRSGFLKLLRESGIAYLARGVDLEQGRLSLHSRTLRIDFDPELRQIRHISAHGNVVFTMDGQTAGEGAAAGESGVQALEDDGGRKTLHASQLEIFFPRESGETTRLEYLVARGTDAHKATLRFYPPEGEGAEAGNMRQLEGRRLVFRFHPDGRPNRLDSFHAEGGARLKIIEQGAEDIQLTGDTLTARFDPQLQELQAAEISGKVHFSRGPEHIRGERASYDSVGGMLLVTGEENGRLPRMWNETVELEALRILHSVDGQLLQAEEDVWVSVRGEGGDMGLDVALFGEGNDEEPIYIHADLLESDLDAGVSSFSGTVRVLKGENVLSTRNLWLYHEERRLEALERVSLIIHPLAETLEETAQVADNAEEMLPTIEPLTGGLGELPEEVPAEEPFDRSAPLQITCRELIYDDHARYIILNDRVNVRKHKTRLAADHMEVQLGQDDNNIEHIIASAQVAAAADAGLAEGSDPDRLMTGFDRQASRRTGSTPAMTVPQAGEGSSQAGGDGAVAVTGTAAAGGAAAGTAPGAGARPVVPQVTLSQPGGRVANGERVLYYPGDQVAVLVGIDTVATVVDPRTGSAQGTSLTYHLADGKILNRANENEVTLVLLHSGASSTKATGAGSSVPNRGNRGGRATSTRSPATGFSGRSASR